jgi:membrane protein implicated in regulation of membrane protease activity
MAQLITLLILVCAGWWLYRRFISDAQKLAEKSRRAEKERKTGAIGTLVKDPATGEYRLKQEDE